MTRLAKLAMTVEIIAILVIGIGIGIETATGADAGYIVITTGAGLVALGSLVWIKVVRRS